MPNLFTPWRYAYLSGGRRPKGCVFCKAGRSRDDARALLVHRGRHNYIILNRYPYNSGHLMIVPYAHLGDLDRGTGPQLREMMELAARCERVLKRVYRIQGLNLGMNLGSPAGAGIRGHIHLHLVPRWSGDTNFMTVVGRTRVTPEDLEVTRLKLATQFRGRKARKVAHQVPAGIRRRTG
jgi:ATP adenylyltransferase